MPLLQHQEHFAGLIKCCVDPRSLALLHSQIRESGLGTDRYLGNLLIHKHGRIGNPEDAFQVFQEIKERNIFSWSSLLGAFATSKSLDGAKVAFERMPERNRVCWTSMVLVNAKLGHLQLALDLFQGMPERDMVSWTVLFQITAEVGLVSHSRYLFEKMPEHDLVSMNAMVAAYAQTRHFGEALSLFYHLPERTAVSWSLMVSALADQGRVTEAKIMFDSMPQRNVVAWNALASAYAQCGHISRLRKIFGLMPQTTAASWNTLVVAFASDGRLEDALDIFHSIPERNEISWNALIQAHSSPGSRERVFGKMPSWDVVSWTLLISLCSDAKEVQPLFDKMPSRNAVSWTTLVTANAQGGRVRQAEAAFVRMPQHGRAAATSMVAAYGHAGRIDDAVETFESMRDRDVVAWTAAVAANAQNGLDVEAIRTFHLAVLDGVAPDHLCIGSVLLSCSHLGTVTPGRDYFVSMSYDHSVNPTCDHFLTVVDILGRADRVNDCEELVNTMPYEPGDVAWMSLLGASRSYGNLGSGVRAAKSLIQLEAYGEYGGGSCPYVLLANLFAGAGRHAEAAMVRRAMKEKGVKIQRCVSSIEVGGRDHRFCVGESHPRGEEIARELQRLERMMVVEQRLFLPEIKEVLHDVEEREKRELLWQHSEKLAIGFGLVATPPGTPLWIVKNLRVCLDCHTATKFISLVTKRRIVVRDSNRFHHFDNGKCSCQDYW